MLVLAEAQARANPTNSADRRNLGHAYSSLGWFLALSGDLERGLRLLEQSEAVFASQMAAEPENLEARRNLAIVYSQHGHILYYAAKRYAESQQMQEKSFALLHGLAQADPLNARVRHLEALALLGVGSAQAQRGEARAGLEKQLEAVRWARMLLEADPKNDRARFNASRALSLTGETLVSLGEIQRAEELFGESLRILATSVGGRAQEMTIERALIAFTHFHRGRLETVRKDCVAAREWFERGAPLLEATEKSRTWHVYVAGMSAQVPRLLAACSEKPAQK
jgi:tetratricopeptide (TPR) repeat protein